MTPERLARIERLFHAVRERAPDARESYLDAECYGDVELRGEVLSLLRTEEGQAMGTGGAVAAAQLSVPGDHSGRQLGPYRLAELLGAGGMGEVYRARDTKLGRDVAIKILPSEFSVDAGRLMRFEREARVLAALNHPHIGSIYGIEEQDGLHGLVLELVGGETLAERLKRGKLSVAEAIQISTQIAEALDAAHEKGIVHRDLKPANIRITSEGVVKVLDFGLAKATLARGMDTSAATGDGIVMGTAPYMSPEQARGLPVDKRTDIWAFGCVLFELLTGARAFRGRSVTDILAAVINSEPELRELPEAVTPGLRTLLTRCLQKDTRQRLRDIGDMRIELEMATAQAAAPTMAPLGRRVLPWGLAGLGFALALALWVPWRKTAPPAPRHLEASVGADVSLVFNLGAAAILSPDGQTLAFLARPSGGSPQLFLRPLDQLTATPLAGTDNALSPFFSPDGRWIAFFADGKLKKISVTGGAAVTICDAPIGRGGSWGDDGMIAFAPNNTVGTRVLRVSSAGGVPAPLTTLADGEVSHRFPQLLPDGKAVLYTSSSSAGNWDNATLVVQPLPTGPRKAVQRGGMYGRYLSSGHVAYVRGGTLFAVPFDLARLEVAGPPVAALEGVVFNTFTGGAQVAASETGTLVYSRGRAGLSASIVWIDRAGKTATLRTLPANWGCLVFSPDGTRLALQILDEKGFDVWVYDWARDALSRLTSHAAGGDFSPVWTPDGRRIVFASLGPEGQSLYWRRADGTGNVQRLTEGKGTFQYPASWHPSGKLLAFYEHRPQTDYDLMLLPLEGDEVSGWKPGTPSVFLDGPFMEREPVFSPDGRWLAYQANDTGRDEVYVRPFPGPGGKWQVSVGGGVTPTWSRNRVVNVCTPQFVASKRGHAENALIHEMLHTLGLGENPPSSSEITHRVKARCGF